MRWRAKNRLLRGVSSTYRKRGIVIGFLVVICLGTAFAQSNAELPWSNSGFDQRYYFGFGLGVSELEPESMCPCLTVSDGTDQAINAYVGLDLSRHITVEGFLTEMGAAKIQFNRQDVGDVDYQIGGISVLGYLFGSRLGSSDSQRSALDSREGLSGFVRLGLGLMENDSNLDYDRDHTVHVHAGLGVEYAWSNGFAVRGEVVGYDTDAAYAGISILKRFGKSKTTPAPAEEKQSFTAVTDPEVEEEVVLERSQSPQSFEAAITYFEFGKFDITPESAAILTEVARSLRENTSIEVIIEGHTDEIDTEEYNMMLSINRAAEVKKFLVEQGVDGIRMRMTGYGELRPIADNKTEEGRQLNRRVEILLR